MTEQRANYKMLKRCAHVAACPENRENSHSKGGVMDRAELKTILDKHCAWLDDPTQGERADLRDADLRGADLRDAYLRGANLVGANLRDADLRGANLVGANLRDAYLRDAYLRDADLRGANLVGANLRGADLVGANLRGADLRDADLRGADLRDADLRDADLRGAYLRGTDLRDADLRGATMPTGETWEQYLADTVPALLCANGKTVKDIVASGAWECHSWTNCPMAVAFDCDSVSDIPTLFRPRAEQFIQLFDANLIPCPEINT